MPKAAATSVCPDHSHIQPTGITCPACKEGEIVPGRGRFGLIYKCSKRGCTFTLTSRPTGALCDYPRNGGVCGRLMVEGTKTIPNRCGDRTCPNRNPHKLSPRAGV